MFQKKEFKMNEKVSPLTRLMDIYGSTSKIATKLEVDRQVVDGWYSRGRIPFRRGDLIHEKTNGEITKNEIWEWANKTLAN
jgi:DNA-binding transcriptional regulator YdaS (Cro superfamily)